MKFQLKCNTKGHVVQRQAMEQCYIIYRHLNKGFNWKVISWNKDKKEMFYYDTFIVYCHEYFQGRCKQHEKSMISVLIGAGKIKSYTEKTY